MSGCDQVFVFVTGICTSYCLQGSDIETLGAEAAVECGRELLEHLPVGETKLQEAQASTSTGKNPLFLGLTVKINY